MGNFSAGGWLVMGIALVVLGLLVKFLGPILVSLTTWALIILGIIAVVVGLVGMVSGRGRDSDHF